LSLVSCALSLPYYFHHISKKPYGKSITTLAPAGFAYYFSELYHFETTTKLTMRTKLFALAAFSILFLASCKKDNDNTDNSETKTEILTKSAWKFETYGVDTDGNKTLAGAEIGLRDCDLDDAITFSANKTYLYNSGSNNCGSAPVTAESTWTFYDNETYFDYRGTKMKIITLTNTKMELHNDGPASTYIVILKK
jgi:hypothetical protein